MLCTGAASPVLQRCPAHLRLPPLGTTALPGCGGRARVRGWALGAFPDLTSSLFSTSVSQQVTAIVTAIELEGAFKGHLVQQPRNKEGHRSSSRLSRAWSSLAL